jgi:DNA polymerase-3 subunit delta'
MVTEPQDLLPWLHAPLEQAVRMRAHALLLHGLRGVGQFELGMVLGRALLCESEAPPRPCGRCTACTLLRARAHPDFRALVPEALAIALGWLDDAGDAEGSRPRTAKPSREIRVEAVRTAIDWSHQTPSRGRGKVLLIHPAQAMNGVTANALLKTLEEPPGSLRLVLCTSDPELLLPTLRSRCQRLLVEAPMPAEALSWLGGQGVGDPAVLLAAAGGRPLEALALAGEGLDAERWTRLPGSISRGEVDALSGLTIPRIVDTLQKLCHDAMARAAGGAARYFDESAFPPPGPLAPLVAWSRSLTRVARNDEHPWQAALLADALVTEAQRALAATPPRARSFDTLPVS